MQKLNEEEHKLNYQKQKLEEIEQNIKKIEVERIREKEIKILNKFKEDFFLTRSKRIDPSHRVLTWKLLFPNQIKIPFLMTPFNTNPKPKNFVHPNKINRIKQISYCTEVNIIPIINELCNDDRLQLSAGKGECKVTYE